MNKNQMNGSDEEFELMGDMPREDPVIAKVNLSINKILFNLIEIFSASSFT
jgi:hypothetical protein